MKNLSAFLLTGEDHIRPNRNINEASAIQLETLALSLHKWNRPDIEFTTGIWLSGVWFPERLPAIAIPTLRIMERLDALGVHDCHYTLYQARDFLIAEQWLDLREAIQISNHMERYIRDYIRRLYPHLEKSIDLVFDKKIDTDELEKVKATLRKSDLADMKKILAYAQSKWRDRESAYTYAAANIVCNLYAGKAHHIVVGWEKERPFFRLWQSYEAMSAGIPQSIFLIQSSWYIPPYYLQKWEESYFDQEWKLVEWPEVSENRHIAYDQSIL